MRVDLRNPIQTLIVSIGILPIVPNAFTGVLPLVLLTAAIIHFVFSSKKNPDWKTTLLNASLFLTYFLTFLYSDNLGYAFRKIGPFLWALIFPLTFFIFLNDLRLEKKTIRSFIGLFNLSNLAYATICIIYLCNTFDLNLRELNIPPVYEIRGALENIPIIGRHPIYTALLIGISVLFHFNFLLSKSKKNKVTVVLSFFSLLYLLAFVLFIQSKGAIFYLLATFPILTLMHFKNKLKATVLLSLIFLGTCIWFLTLPQSLDRFQELIESKTYESETINPYNSSQIRMAIWRAAIDNIEEAPFLGYGLGDVQDELNKTYEENAAILLEETYNSHNQYLGVWLTAGVAGFLIFVFFLYINLIQFWAGRKWQPEIIASFAILIFFCLNFLTENILDRQLGSLTFFYFINLFGAYNKTRNT